MTTSANFYSVNKIRHPLKLELQNDRATQPRVLRPHGFWSRPGPSDWVSPALTYSGVFYCRLRQLVSTRPLGLVAGVRYGGRLNRRSQMRSFNWKGLVAMMSYYGMEQPRFTWGGEDQSCLNLA